MAISERRRFRYGSDPRDPDVGESMVRRSPISLDVWTLTSVSRRPPTCLRFDGSHYGSRQRAEAPAAYLAFPGLRFTRLPQRYERVGRAEYSYEAPTVGYAGILKVSSLGAVVQYPGLFELISTG